MAVEWLDNLSAAIAAFRGAVSLAREVRPMLPQAQQKAVDAALEQADKAAQIAEAQIAKGLGYDLCTCSFPPTIMLLCRDGAMHPMAAEFRRCTACGREAPSQFIRQRKSENLHTLDRIELPRPSRI
jgi:hypothetical protein